MTTNTQQRTQKQAVSMYPDDWATVKRVADTTGVRSLSAALRLIIREFERMQREGDGNGKHLIVVS